MAEFSTSGAVGAGFGLIAKRPLSVLLWGVVYLLLITVPIGLILLWLGNDLPGLFKDIQAVQARMETDPSSATPPMELFKLQAHLMVLQPVIFVASLAGRALITGAVFRAVLEPDNRSFAAMRFGKAELWLALLIFAKQIILAIFMVGVVLGGVLLCGLAWLLGGLVPEPGTGWVRALLIIAVVIATIVVGIWLVLRLSLAAPMTFAAKEFRLFESWTVTRGQSWNLLVVSLLLGLIAMGIGMVMSIFMFIGMAGVVHPIFSLDRSADLAARLPDLAAAVAPLLLILGVIELLVIGPLMAIFTAPWAYIYRELSRDAKPVHPPVF